VQEELTPEPASLLLAFQDLLLEGVWLREVDADLVGGDLVVDLGHSIDLVFNLLLVKGVKVELDVLLAIEANSG
jgi:hypothetical protein